MNRGTTSPGLETTFIEQGGGRPEEGFAVERKIVAIS
jgi:hypothetical protein